MDPLANLWQTVTTSSTGNMNGNTSNLESFTFPAPSSGFEVLTDLIDTDIKVRHQNGQHQGLDEFSLDSLQLKSKSTF